MQQYANSGAAPLLFQACDAYYQAGEYGPVAERAKELVEKVGTDAALRLALHGAFAAEQPDLCLELLRENQAMLQGGKLSPELGRLHAACLQKIGQLDKAIRAAEALFRERPGPETFAEFFRILIQAGDTSQAAIIARELLTLAGTDVPLFLQAASFTRLHDLNLAQALWRKAAAKPLKTTKLLMGVVGMAYTLGMEHEAAPLQARLFKRAKRKGPIQTKTLDEVREIIRKRQEEYARLAKSYDSSEAPIHLIASPVGAPLVLLYHGQLQDNRAATDLTQVPPLLARYGGRALPEKSTHHQLIADITGLILAADLEILDLVETHLGPVLIAPETPESLVQQIVECRPHQPSQHAWRMQVQQMVTAGDITVVDAAAAPVLPAGHPLQPLGRDWQVAWRTAQDSNAILGIDWPLTTEDLQQPVSLPTELAKGTINLRELLQATYDCGALPAEEMAKGVGAAGVFRMYPVRDHAQERVPVGTPVLLSGVPLEIIANQGMLKPLAKAFRVRILREDLERIAEEEREYAKRMTLAEWTQALVDRIKAGIVAERYIVVPQAIPTKQVQRMSLDARGLANLLKAVQGKANASLWCDDRSINRHALAGSRPPVDILDVMDMLRSKGLLSEAAWHEKLNHLRRGNVRYVPSSAEEIMGALKLAPIENGTIVETGELMTLRRYYAACLLERGRLLGPRQGTPDLQEWNFILGLRQATDGAFRDLWAQNMPAKSVVAQANWLWQWLYVDLVGLRSTVMKEIPVQQERELTALQIGSLFSLGISLSFRPLQTGEASPRELYFNWLHTKLLLPLEHANPGFIESVAQVVARDIERTCRETLKLPAGERRKGQLIVTTKLFVDLPEELRKHVILPADVLAGLGVTVHGPTVMIEGEEFDLAELSAAQAEALANGAAKLSSRDRNVEWHLARVPTTDLTLRITFPDGQEKTWREPELAALVPEVIERMERLERFAYLFDCDTVLRGTAIHEISRLEKPVDRVLRLHEWRMDSPQVLYRELNRKLATNEEVELDDLRIPNWSRLLTHLRLPAGAGEVTADLDTAAAAFLKDEGLLVAMRCFMAMPRRMPELLENAWRELPEAKAKKMWEDLPRFPRSVLADLHLVRLAHLRVDTDRAIVERILDELLDRENGEVLVDSFLATLVWVERELIRWPHHRELPAWRRLILVWYHASRLHGIFRATQVDLSQVAGYVRAHTSSWHHGVMDYDPAYARDLSHPCLTGAGTIVLNGLANLLEGLSEEDVDAIGVPAKWQALAQKDARYAGTMLLDLCRRTDLASNMLGAFLANSPATMRDRLLGSGWDAGLKLAGGNIPLGELLAWVAEDVYDIERWSALLASVRELPMPEENKAALRGLLTSIDWDEFLVKLPEWSRVVMTFSAAQARSLDAEFRELFEDVLFKIARGNARRKMVEKEARLCDVHLVQALLALSIVPGDQAKTATNFFERVARLMRVLPAVAQLLDGPMRHWLSNLPFEQQRGLRQLWYQMRAQR